MSEALKINVLNAIGAALHGITPTPEQLKSITRVLNHLAEESGNTERELMRKLQADCDQLKERLEQVSLIASQRPTLDPALENKLIQAATKAPIPIAPTPGLSSSSGTNNIETSE